MSASDVMYTVLEGFVGVTLVLLGVAIVGLFIFTCMYTSVLLLIIKSAIIYALYAVILQVGVLFGRSFYLASVSLESYSQQMDRLRLHRENINPHHPHVLTLNPHVHTLKGMVMGII